MEICQGGPHVGTLTIDGYGFGPRRFLDKFVETDDIVFVSEFVRGFFYAHFRLVRIDRVDMSETLLIKKEYLEPMSFTENRLSYKEDAWGRVVNVLQLELR